MILLLVALLVLHQGYAVVPVITVELGETVTFTCALPEASFSRRELHWYKQSAWETLKSVVTLQGGKHHVYGPEYSAARLDVKVSETHCNLTILRTIQEDEGMFHCALVHWIHITWSSTFLSFKGLTQRTSTYTVVQGQAETDPVPPGDLMTLQCSVLSDSKRKTCPRDHSVFWLRSADSQPDIVYTDGKTSDECEQRSDAQTSCVYRFSKNVSSSDAGAYFCALATCGEILFGDITKVHIGRTVGVELIALVIVAVFLVISLIGNIVFICYRNSTPACPQSKGVENAAPEARQESSSQPLHNMSEADLNYAALHFSGNKATRGRKNECTTEESVYSHVKHRM